ncbi:hypothetical protein ACHQM5_001918 [Ranunculus cassubicifolius]
MAGTSKKTVCYQCGELGHLSFTCPWIHIECSKCHHSEMKVFICKKEGPNQGRSFLKCKTQPKCSNFIWTDEYTKEHVAPLKTVELEVEGKMKMKFKGDVDSLCQIVRKLELN